MKGRHQAGNNFASRDRQIIEHVSRFRMTTNSALKRLLFSEVQPNAVTKVTTRLCRKNILARYTLCHPRTYLTLGPIGAQQLGLPAHRTLPLGPQSLPTEYAVLAYSAFTDPPRLRLTAAELHDDYPWLPSPFRDFPHCRTPALSPVVLELLRVDLGGKPDHVIRKCSRDIDARMEIPEFAQLVRAGCFRLVIVTATAQKAASLRLALDHHVWPVGIQFHLAVVPDLLIILGASKDAS